MRLNIKFHKILPINFCSSAAQNLCHRQTDGRTDIYKDKNTEIVCSRHPKTCRSVKNWKSKIITIPILSSYLKHRIN